MVHGTNTSKTWTLPCMDEATELAQNRENGTAV